MKICKTCGKELYDETQICDGCGNIPDISPEQLNPDEQPKKKKKKSMGIISTILILIVARLVGGFLGEKMATSMNDSATTNQLDTFIEQVTSEYTAGTLTDTGYSSQYFGFDFKTDDNWVMYDKNDIQAASEQSQKAALESGINALKEENVPEKYIDKWKQTVIFNVEMMASYEQDDIVAGESIVIAYTAYGVEDMAKDEISSLMISKAGFSEDAVQNVGTVKIAGIQFEHTKASVVVEDDEIINNILIGKKDNVICMILNRAVKGYEDDVYESFLNNISSKE